MLSTGLSPISILSSPAPQNTEGKYMIIFIFVLLHVSIP
jgi:hypothetical protein